MNIEDLHRIVDGTPRFHRDGDTLIVDVERGSVITRGSMSHAERQALVMFLVDDCEVRTAEELPVDGGVHTVREVVLRRDDGSELCVPELCVIPPSDFDIARELLAAGAQLFRQPFPKKESQ